MGTKLWLGYEYDGNIAVIYKVVCICFKSKAVLVINGTDTGSLKFSKLQSKFKNKVVFNCVVLSS